MCIKYSSILIAAFGSNVTAKRKGELWAEITAKVNQAQKEMLIKNGDGMCGFSGRSVEQVRKKWKNIRTSAVSCVRQYTNYCKGTGKFKIIYVPFQLKHSFSFAIQHPVESLLSKFLIIHHKNHPSSLIKLRICEI